MINYSAPAIHYAGVVIMDGGGAVVDHVELAADHGRPGLALAAHLVVLDDVMIFEAEAVAAAELRRLDLVDLEQAGVEQDAVGRLEHLDDVRRGHARAELGQ